MARRRIAGGRDAAGIAAFQAALGLGGEKKRGGDGLTPILKSMLQERQAQDRLLGQFAMQALGARYVDERQRRTDLRNRGHEIRNEVIKRTAEFPYLDTLVKSVHGSFPDEWDRANTNERIGMAIAWFTGIKQFDDGRVGEVPLTNNHLVELKEYIGLMGEAEHYLKERKPPPRNISEMQSSANKFLKDVSERYGIGEEDKQRGLTYAGELFRMVFPQ